MSRARPPHAPSDPRPPPGAQGQRTRQRILDAAAELMFRRGVAGTSIPAVQEAARVSASQIYHYFGDKAGLVRSVMDLRISAAEASGAFQPERFASVAALEAWRDLVLGIQIDRDCVGGCEFGVLVSELADTAPGYRADAVAGFARLEAPIRDGLRTMRGRGALSPDADPDALALALLAALQGGLLLAKARRDVSGLRAVLDAVLDRIRALATEPAGDTRPARPEESGTGQPGHTPIAGPVRPAPS